MKPEQFLPSKIVGTKLGRAAVRPEFWKSYFAFSQLAVVVQLEQLMILDSLLLPS